MAREPMPAQSSSPRRRVLQQTQVHHSPTKWGSSTTATTLVALRQSIVACQTSITRLPTQRPVSYILSSFNDLPPFHYSQRTIVPNSQSTTYRYYQSKTYPYCQICLICWRTRSAYSRNGEGIGSGFSFAYANAWNYKKRPFSTER